MNETQPMSETPVTQPAFLTRLAEFENAVELSVALADQAEQLERRYLGHREDVQTPPQGGPAHTPLSFNDALEVHAINLKISLERMSYSLRRLDDASNGIPLDQDPVDDDPLEPRTFGATTKAKAHCNVADCDCGLPKGL